MMKIETGHLLNFLPHCELAALCLCAEVYCYRCAEDVKLMGHHRWQKLCKRLQDKVGVNWRCNPRVRTN